MTYEEVSKSLYAAAMQLSPDELPQFLADHAEEQPNILYPWKYLSFPQDQ